MIVKKGKGRKWKPNLQRTIHKMDKHRRKEWMYNQTNENQFPSIQLYAHVQVDVNLQTGRVPFISIMNVYKQRIVCSISSHQWSFGNQNLQNFPGGKKN